MKMKSITSTIATKIHTHQRFKNVPKPTVAGEADTDAPSTWPAIKFSETVSDSVAPAALLVAIACFAEFIEID